MSDNFLKLIATNPNFIPTDFAQRNAETFLTSRYPNNRIEIITTESVKFVDQGSNFESVACNLCGKTLEIETWQNAMDYAYQNRFEDLHFVTPCCNKTNSLNDLHYTMPAGFARHVMIISNPQNELSKQEISKLEEIVETSLRSIWAHY